MPKKETIIGNPIPRRNKTPGGQPLFWNRKKKTIFVLD